jgi:hypothetical protein
VKMDLDLKIQLANFICLTSSSYTTFLFHISVDVHPRANWSLSEPECDKLVHVHFSIYECSQIMLSPPPQLEKCG